MRYCKTGLENPKIAVAGFNPHAGENGLIGTEDGDVLVPTVAALRAEGFNVEGPIPGDTVFVKAAAGLYDAVIAMYHDQGHIPIKLLGFSVNDKERMGEPVGRQCHARAADHPHLGRSRHRLRHRGKGTASSQSMIEAIEFAGDDVARVIPAHDREKWVPVFREGSCARKSQRSAAEIH